MPVDRAPRVDRAARRGRGDRVVRAGRVLRSAEDGNAVTDTSGARVQPSADGRYENASSDRDRPRSAQRVRSLRCTVPISRPAPVLPGFVISDLPSAAVTRDARTSAVCEPETSTALGREIASFVAFRELRADARLAVDRHGQRLRGLLLAATTDGGDRDRAAQDELGRAATVHDQAALTAARGPRARRRRRA